MQIYHPSSIQDKNSQQTWTSYVHYRLASRENHEEQKDDKMPSMNLNIDVIGKCQETGQNWVRNEK